MSGDFIWHDLATTDPEAAARFYAAIMGWEIEPVPDMHYTLFKVGPDRAAGLMALPPHLQDAGVPPHWSGYIHVDDVDATATRAAGQGATLKHGPADIEGVGRFAVLTDPDGAPFTLFSPAASAEPPGMMARGRVGWNELIAGNGERAFAFYAGLFGWQRGTAIDMGPMGAYQLFQVGGQDRGGIMTAPPGTRPHWRFYVTVDALDAAMARVLAAGGVLDHGPQEVPGGAWVASGRDPQGARFALVSMTR